MQATSHIAHRPAPMRQRTRIKICGVRDVETALAAAEAGADAIGLVFVRASPRAVSPEQARRIVDALPAFVEPVGLFADAPPTRVLEIAAAARLRTVQLHGSEQPADIERIGSLQVIKALPFDPARADRTVAPWRLNRPRNLAALLWDAPPSADATCTGGSGDCLDWAALAELQNAGALEQLPPTILAGGLTPQNVARAVAAVRPFAVDVSSGVESSRGVKDHDNIRAFCEAVHAVDRDA